MDSFDSHGTVWETLAKKAKDLGLRDLVALTGLDPIALRRSLGNLVRVGLVNVVGPTAPTPLFSARTRLDAIQWARAVEMGIPLDVIESLATLEKRTRAEALRAASDGTLDRLRAKEKTAMKKNREAVLRGRAASKAASTDLALLSKDLEVALSQSPQGSGLDARATRFVLERAFDEAQHALTELTTRLMKK